MKKIILNKDEVNEVSWPLSEIVQFTGQNTRFINELIEIINNYFKNKNSEELSSSIYLGEDKLPKSFFEVLVINNKNELKEQITINKNSLLEKVIKTNLENINQAINFEKNNDLLCEISLEIEKNFIFSDCYEISFEDYNKEKFLKQNLKIDIKESSLKNEFQMLLIFINMLLENYKKDLQQQLIILNNVDMYLTKSEYDKLVQLLLKLKNTVNVYFILITNKKGYCYIVEETMESIVVFNDKIFNVPKLNILKDFIINNYPINCEFSNESILELLQDIIHEIYLSMPKNNLKSKIVQKILNEEMNIKNEVKIVSKIELEYLTNN